MPGTADEFIALLEAELCLAQLDLECLENQLAILKREQERLLGKRAIRRVQVRLISQYSQRDYAMLRGQADQAGRSICPLCLLRAKGCSYLEEVEGLRRYRCGTCLTTFTWHSRPICSAEGFTFQPGAPATASGKTSRRNASAKSRPV